MRYSALCMILILFGSNAGAETCLDVYKNKNENEKYKSEIKLANEIETYFKEKNIKEVTAAVLEDGSTTKLNQINKFVTRYSEEYCKIKKSPIGKCSYEYHEMVVALVLHYQKGDFCPDGKPWSLNKILRNLFLVPSSKDFVLNSFRSFEAKEEGPCPFLHGDSLPKVKLNEKGLRQILTSFEESKLLPKMKGFSITDKTFFLPEAALHGTALEKMDDPRFGKIHKNAYGNAVVLKKPDVFENNQEFESAFAQLAEALVKNKRLHSYERNYDVYVKLAEYYQIPDIAKPLKVLEQADVAFKKSIGLYDARGYLSTETKVRYTLRDLTQSGLQMPNHLETLLSDHLDEREEMPDFGGILGKFFNDETMAGEKAPEVFRMLIGFIPNYKEADPREPEFVKALRVLHRKYAREIDDTIY